MREHRSPISEIESERSKRTSRTSAAAEQQGESWRGWQAAVRRPTSCLREAPPVGSTPDMKRIKTKVRLERKKITLCRTALAGLFPASDSLLRCWWLSARHSTSANLDFPQLLKFTKPLRKPRVERHGRMGGVLCEVQEGCAPQLLLNDQGLLQQLEPSGQELVLDLQEIPFSHVHLENKRVETFRRK